MDGEPTVAATFGRMRAGLCADCRHARIVRAGSGSVFLLCAAAADDPRLPRYPSLPRHACAGHERLPAPVRRAEPPET